MIPSGRSTIPTATPAVMAASRKPRTSDRARARVRPRKLPFNRRRIWGANACNAAPPTGAAPTITTSAAGAPSQSRSGTNSASEA